MRNVLPRLMLLLLITALEVISILYIFYKMNSYGILLYIALLVVSIIFIVARFTNNHFPSLAWIIIILALPGAGCTIYLLFSNQPKKSSYHLTENTEQHRLAKIITYYTGIKPKSFSNFKYLSPGEVAFNEVLQELKKAKEYIYIEFYIIASGKMWDQIFEVLKEKRKMNVRIIIVYDDFGCLKKLSSKRIKQIKNQGIELYRFNMIAPLLSSTLNYRNHRKLIIIDGNASFLGGMNIADEYVNYKERFGYWKDAMIFFSGEIVSTLVRQIDILKPYYNFLPTFNESKMQILLESPYYDIRITKLVILKMINDATSSIYITTPYFIIDYEIKNALIAASASGVKVKIVIPKVPDKKVVYWITKLNLLEMLKQNTSIEIYCYLPGFIHSKMLICDETLTLIGSANFDFRSLYTNYEISAVIYDKQATQVIVEDFHKITLESRLLQEEDYKMNVFKKIIISLMRVFETLL